MPEYRLKKAFVQAANKLIVQRESIIANLEVLFAGLKDTGDMEERLERLADEMKNLHRQIERHVGTAPLTSQDEYRERYEELVAEFEDAKREHEELARRYDDCRSRAATLRQFISGLEEAEPLEEFDAQLWCSLVDHMTVYTEKDIRVTFKDGTEVKA